MNSAAAHSANVKKDGGTAKNSAPGKSAGKVTDSYVPMRDRFKAWWTGEDVQLVPQNIGPGVTRKDMAIAIDGDDTSVDEDSDNLWCSARLEVIQNIWGEGFIEPGGAKITKNLLGWLGLNSRQSVLDLTAALGGTARSVASAHGLWMDALEPIPALASEGRRLSVSVGLGRQVPISSVDLETHSFSKARYDAIYSRERLFTVRNKARLLTGCAEALKETGQILITDYMRSADVGGAELAANWGRHEKEMPSTWTMKAYLDCLRELDLRIHIEQDISEEMVEHIYSAWRKIPNMIAEGKFSHRQISYLVREGEIWLDRLSAIESGQLIVGRIHAQNTKK